MDYKTHKDSELCHYGVPGMKWGRRKFNGKSPTIRGATTDKTGPAEENRRRAETMRNKTDPAYRLKKQTQLRRETTLNNLSNKSKTVKYGLQFVEKMLNPDTTTKR